MRTAEEMRLFHFRCPLCGAETDELPLSEAADLWAGASKARVHFLTSSVITALREIGSGPGRWMTEKFGKSRDKLDAAHGGLFGSQSPKVLVLIEGDDRDGQFARIDCPLCLAFSGPRRGDGYFAAWSAACTIQVSNLAYESSLILWCVLRSMPEGWTGDELSQLNDLRIAVYRTGLAAAPMACPQCGRPVTCLFGGGPEDSGRHCRHCADMAGGGRGVFVTVISDPKGDAIVDGPERDAAGPARITQPLLPPDIGRHWPHSLR